MSRESHIEFDMNYCQHYDPQPGGRPIVCHAGMDIKKIQCVETPSGDGQRKVKWGPCIGGHTLENPTSYCQCWVRRTREHAEKRADDIEQMLTRMQVVDPVVNKWRVKPRPERDRQEVIECPVCKGRLHLTQSSYNGHVHGHCETKDCVSWME